MPLIFLCAAAVIKTYLIFSLLPSRVKSWDFDLYYASALALREKSNPYTVDFEPVAARLGITLSRDYKTVNTPTFLLCFEPLTALPMTEAYWIWIALNVLAFTAALLMILRPSASGLDARTPWAVAALAVLYPPVGIHFEYGQAQILVLFLLVMAQWAIERDHGWTAGFTLALAALLRAFPVLMLGYLMMRRNWRILYRTMIALILGAVATIVPVGSPCLDYLQGMQWGVRRVFLELPENVALAPFVSRAFWLTSGFFAGAQHDLIRRSAVLLAETFLLALTARATMRSREDPDWRGFSLWVVTAILLSPLAWIHYLVLLIIPFAQLTIAASAGRASTRTILLMIGSYVLVGLSRKAAATIALPSALLLAVKESGFISLLMAYVASFWFVADYRVAREPGPADRADGSFGGNSG